MTASEIEMACEDVGSGQPIIFLHGFPFNRSMWREQIDFLSANGFRAIAPDLRGLGKNRSRAEIVTMDDMARDAAALMDELRIDRAVICGLSMGCYVALEFVSLFPLRASALILAGARAQGPDEAEKKSREEQAQRVLAEGMSFAVESISTKLLAQKTVTEKPEVVARVRDMVLSTDPQGAAAAQRGMAARRDYTDDLANIPAPTLIVAGREDGVRTAHDAEFIHTRIRNSRLEIIDDAGHLMNMEQPEVFNEVMLDFVGKLNH